MKYFLYSVFFFCTWALAAQQDLQFKGDGEYFTLGVGIPIATVRDLANSPLAYRGTGFRIFTSYENIQPNRVFRLDFSLDNITMKAYVKPRQDVKKETGMTDMNLGIAYYTRMGTNTDGTSNRQYLGAKYYLQINQREYSLPSNNITGFLFQTSLGVGFLDQRNLEANKWDLNSSVDLPLLGVIYRPTYIGLPDMLTTQKVKLGTILKNFKPATLNKFFKINFGFDFDRSRKEWRTSRYSYQWNMLYTPIPTHKSLISTTGSLNYGYRVLR